ncbi:MAG: AtuA-related protein [Nocardioides sp.]
MRLTRRQLPNLNALNLVTRRLRGAGTTSTRRLDAQAKVLGEWLRYSLRRRRNHWWRSGLA